ncbi:MAG: YceI family protein [Desulfuromusa sp.]|jgi:hypothetical protein|nr:YceI family protein [Desulfuromusa sp.]
MMVFRIWTVLITFLLMATTAGAMTIEGECKIRFSGDSTLHGFAGQSVCQPFSLQSEGADLGRTIIRPTTVNVLVADMDTDNSKRDKKMNEMFDAEHFPVIKGLFGDFNPREIVQQLLPGNELPGLLGFDLTIRDVTQRVQANVRDLVETSEQISFVAEFPVSLTSFKLKAPGVLGIIKVGDQVQVEIDVVLHLQGKLAE